MGGGDGEYCALLVKIVSFFIAIMSSMGLIQWRVILCVKLSQVFSTVEYYLRLHAERLCCPK